MSDEQAIGTVVHLYVDGMAFCNEAALRKAFHPDAKIIGNYEGSVEWMSRDEFIAAILAEPPAPPGTQPLMDIESPTSRATPPSSRSPTNSPACASPIICRW